MNLNISQKEAAAHRCGPCMILAGPGSGKTTVIVERTRRLTDDYGVPPDHILVITFTRAAAEEMKKRYLKATGASETRITFGTFHAVFYMMLRASDRYGKGTITDPEVRLRLLSDILCDMEPDLEPDREFLIGLLNEISFVKNNRVDLTTYQTKNPRINFKELYLELEKRMRKRGELDFDDLLLETYRMLQADASILAYWQKQFTYILVDEFQDINPLQFEIVKLLALPENNLFIVGDDDQSIYGFRGACPKIMLEFPKHYPNCKKILLDVNYRSKPQIVRSSLSIIAHNKERFTKELKSSRAGEADSALKKLREVFSEGNSEKEGLVERCEFPNEAAECEDIVAQVKEAMEGGTPLDEMAVLSRTNTGQAMMIQKCIEGGIPFITKEKVPNPFMHFVVKPVFSALNFCMGNRTRGNFLRFMNTPNHYFKREDLRTEEIDLNALKAQYLSSEKTQWMAQRIDFFAYQMDFMRKIGNPYAMINYFRKNIGYDDSVKESAEARKMDAEELLKTLDFVQESARSYQDVQSWYLYVAEFSRKLEEQKKDKSPVKDRLMVATLHASKGLEYREVFLIDLNELVIPHIKSRGEEQIEEERRLLYVGMTRAKDKLHLYSVRERYGRAMQESRFLKEIKGMTKR